MIFFRRVTRFLGPRTLKTGIAVIIAVFLSGYIPYSLPLLAGVAAVICIQPSITVGVQKGLTRIKTTILAGLVGLVLHYLFGANAIVMGLAVIVLIPVLKKLNWDEGISLAAITIIAIMSEDAGNAPIYAIGRATSTLIGIGVASITNILVAPPRHKRAFRQELKQLTLSFPELYAKAVEAYATNDINLAAQVLTELEETEKEITSLSIELEYLQTSAESSYGTYLEGVKLREVILFEQGVSFLEDVIAKIRDVVEVTHRRCQRRAKLIEQGKQKERSVEFEELVTSVQQLSAMLGELHEDVFSLVGQGDVKLLEAISQQSTDIKQLKEQVRLRLKNWQCEHIHNLDIFSLMSTHRIIFDLEEIANALRQLAKVSISHLEKGKEKLADK